MATIRLVPSTINNAAGTNYLTITNANNAYANTDSTTYATIQNTNASTSNRYIYLRGFNFSDVPSNAIVNSFTIKIKAYQSGGSTNTSYRPYLCDNTTTITGSCSVITTSTQTLTFTGVTADWDTIKGYGSNFGIRINCRRNARNTVAYFYIYGAEILVDYTVPVYHNVTVTGDSTKVSPTGTESVLEGSSFSVVANYYSRPTVTDNGVDVSSQLVESTGGTSTLIPYDYTSTNFTVSNISNAYADATSSNYASFEANGGTTGTVYLDLGGAVIPSGATIQSVSCSATLQYNRNGSSSGASASCQLYSGSTAKGSSTSIISSGGTDVAKTTFNLTVGSWTASELANARLYVTMTNNASSTHRFIYIYGVSFNVTFSIDGKIYTYTISSVTGTHTIVVTAPQTTIHVTSVSLNKNSTTLGVGDTEQLIATVAPSNATNKAITWSTSNSSVATVSSSGLVTAVAAGSATITVTTSDGGYTATCTVAVSGSAVWTTVYDNNVSVLSDSPNYIWVQPYTNAFADGETYRVTWGNDVYICQTFAYQSTSGAQCYDGYAIGNPSVDGGSSGGNNEPFLLYRYDTQSLVGGTTSPTGTIHLKIEKLVGGTIGTLYVKVSGSWVEATAVYKKVSGSWVQQTDLTSVFESGINYRVGS